MLTKKTSWNKIWLEKDILFGAWEVVGNFWIGKVTEQYLWMLTELIKDESLELANATVKTSIGCFSPFCLSLQAEMLPWYNFHILALYMKIVAYPTI